MESKYKTESEIEEDIKNKVENMEEDMKEINKGMKELKELMKVVIENEEKVEVNDIKSYYMKESDIMEELKNVGIKNHLEMYPSPRSR